MHNWLYKFSNNFVSCVSRDRVMPLVQQVQERYQRLDIPVLHVEFPTSAQPERNSINYYTKGMDFIDTLKDMVDTYGDVTIVITMPDFNQMDPDVVFHYMSLLGCIRNLQCNSRIRMICIGTEDDRWITDGNATLRQIWGCPGNPLLCQFSIVKEDASL